MKPIDFDNVNIDLVRILKWIRNQDIMLSKVIGNLGDDDILHEILFKSGMKLVLRRRTIGDPDDIDAENWDRVEELNTVFLTHMKDDTYEAFIHKLYSDLDAIEMEIVKYVKYMSTNRDTVRIVGEVLEKLKNLEW